MRVTGEPALNGSAASADHFLFEHDLFGKPLHTFPDHALALPYQPIPNSCSRHPPSVILRMRKPIHAVAVLAFCGAIPVAAPTRAQDAADRTLLATFCDAANIKGDTWKAAWCRCRSRATTARASASRAIFC